MIQHLRRPFHQVKQSSDNGYCIRHRLVVFSVLCANYSNPKVRLFKPKSQAAVVKDGFDACDHEQSSDHWQALTEYSIQAANRDNGSCSG